MDKHCAAVKDWRGGRLQRKSGACTCVLGDQTSVEGNTTTDRSPYSTTTNHPPHPLWLFKPFEPPLCTAALLLSLLHFLHGRVLHSRKGEAAQPPELVFTARVDRPPPAWWINPLFSQPANHGSGMLFAFGRRTGVVSFHHPPFLHPAERKVTLVIPSFTVSARSCPPPDGRWEAAYFTLM